MKNNRILKRIQADLTEDEIKNNSRLSEQKTILEEHYDKCKSLAIRIEEALNYIYQLKQDMEEVGFPYNYKSMSRDDFVKNYFETKDALNVCRKNTDAEMFCKELIEASIDLMNAAKNLNDNLLPKDFTK